MEENKQRTSVRKIATYFSLYCLIVSIGSSIFKDCRSRYCHAQGVGAIMPRFHEVESVEKSSWINNHSFPLKILGVKAPSPRPNGTSVYCCVKCQKPFSARNHQRNASLHSIQKRSVISQLAPSVISIIFSFTNSVPLFPGKF